MEFDINIILVPVTLVFLVAYLADKLVLKQHKFVKANTRLVEQAQKHFKKCQKAFAKALKDHGDKNTNNVEYYTPNANTPSDILALHNDYNAARRKLAEEKSKLSNTKENIVVHWAYEFLPVLLILILVRAFVAEPFNIPSSSMVPSLHTGDFIVVNKSAYGLRLPLIHTKILDTGSPKHGDVLVFRYPKNEKRYYIKRVIGLPNDVVAFNDGVLSINGKVVDTKETTMTMNESLVASLYPSVIGNTLLSDAERVALGQEEEKHAKYRTETLGEHTYTVRYLAKLNSAKDAPFLQENSPLLKASNGTSWQIAVPQGKYFVMGDNRDRSEDGRFWGFVDERQLAGKATYIWLHKDAGFSLPSFDRVGKID